MQLKEFQQSKGLQASGKLDQQTTAALGISADASASTGSSAEKSSAGKSSASGEHKTVQSTGEKPKY